VRELFQAFPRTCGILEKTLNWRPKLDVVRFNTRLISHQSANYNPSQQKSTTINNKTQKPQFKPKLAGKE